MCISHIPPGQILGNGIYIVNAAFCVGGDNAITDRLKGYLRSFLFRENASLRHLAFRDVGYRSFVGNDIAVVIVDSTRVFQNDNLPAVFSTQAIFEVLYDALRLQPCENPLAINGIHVKHGRATSTFQIINTIEAEHIDKRRVYGDDFTIPRSYVNAIHNVLEQATISRLTVLQLFFIDLLFDRQTSK